MSIYDEDEVMAFLHERIGDDHNVREAIAMTIDHFGANRLEAWSMSVLHEDNVIDGTARNNGGS